MTHDLLVVQRTAPEEMERALIAALEPALQAAVWAAVRPILAATVSAHVRALVDGAARFPQPSFVPPPLPSVVPIVSGEVVVAPAPPADPEPTPPVPPTPEAAPTDPEPPKKKYKMGKGSPHRYDDIAWNEIPEDEFDLYEAWPRYLEPVVEYDSDRAPENFRRAVRQDTARFEVSADMRRARKKKNISTQEVLIGTGL